MAKPSASPAGTRVGVVAAAPAGAGSRPLTRRKNIASETGAIEFGPTGAKAGARPAPWISRLPVAAVGGAAPRGGRRHAPAA